jgi:hypothetical protein
MHYFLLIFGLSLQQPQIAPQIESFHAKLNASFSAAHSNIFVLIEILLGIQSEIYVSLRSSATQPIKRVEKEKFLREKMLSFTSGELSRLDFVKDASFKFIT